MHALLNTSVQQRAQECSTQPNSQQSCRLCTQWLAALWVSRQQAVTAPHTGRDASNDHVAAASASAAITTIASGAAAASHRAAVAACASSTAVACQYGGEGAGHEGVGQALSKASCLMAGKGMHSSRCIKQHAQSALTLLVTNSRQPASSRWHGARTASSLP
jgi:hypothetical protein